MEITIRIASQKDFPAILSLIREFSVFQMAPEKVTMTLEQMNDEKEFFNCFVAETEIGEIVGYACFFFAYYSWTGKAIYLDDLYVTEAYRKNKIGKQLLDTVIEYAGKEKCKTVRWLVSNWNTNAIGLYQKIGATINDTEFVCNLNMMQN